MLTSWTDDNEDATATVAGTGADISDDEFEADLDLAAPTDSDASVGAPNVEQIATAHSEVLSTGSHTTWWAPTLFLWDPLYL